MMMFKGDSFVVGWMAGVVMSVIVIIIVELLA